MVVRSVVSEPFSKTCYLQCEKLTGNYQDTRVFENCDHIMPSYVSGIWYWNSISDNLLYCSTSLWINAGWRHCSFLVPCTWFILSLSLRKCALLSCDLYSLKMKTLMCSTISITAEWHFILRLRNMLWSWEITWKYIINGIMVFNIVDEMATTFNKTSCIH